MKYLATLLLLLLAALVFVQSRKAKGDAPGLRPGQRAAIAPSVEGDPTEESSQAGTQRVAVSTETDHLETSGPGVVSVDLTNKEFEVGGVVFGMEGFDAPPACEIEVGIQGRDGVTLAQVVSVSEGGEWGPISLDSAVGERWRFQLRGQNVIPRSEWVLGAAAGHSYELQHAAEPGHLQWFLAYDEDTDEPIEGATFDVSWLAGRQKYSVKKVTPKEGYVFFDGLPSTVINATLTHSKYVGARVEPLAIPIEPAETVWVGMVETLQLEGVCRFAGQPVTEFSIRLWLQGDDSSAHTYEFQGRSNGSFSIPLWPGKYQLSAWSPASPPTDPILVDATNLAEEEPLELDLSGSLLGTGRIVDSETGDEVKFGRMQLLVTDGLTAVGGGPELFMGPSGKFEFAGFKSGKNLVAFTAPGYSTNQVSKISEGGRVEFGTVSLSSRQPLWLNFDVAPSFDRTGCTLAFSAPEDVQGLVLPNEDHVILPDWTSGYTNVLLLRDGVQLMNTGKRLFAGGEWQIDVKMNAITLDVTLGDTGGIGPEDCMLYASMPSEIDSYRRQFAYFDETGAATLYGLEEGQVRVGLRTAAGQVLAERPIHVHAGQPNKVVIGKESKFRYRAQVTSPEGEAIANCGLFVNRPGYLGKFRYVTDDQGWATLEHEFPGECFVRIDHPGVGSKKDIAVTFSDRDEEFVFVLDANARVDLQLVDSLGLKQGVECHLFEGSNYQVAYSDANGFVRWSGLEEGKEVVVEVVDREYFSSRVGLNASISEELKVVELARSGDLEVRVTNAEGVLISELPLELVHRLQETSVSRWAENDQIEVALPLRTNENGMLVIKQLPAGIYDWSVPGAGENFGSLTVVRGQLNRQLLVVGPE